MAFAQFYQSTATGTTSVTMFGTLGPWIEMPDYFPPILWIQTSSTLNQQPNNGLQVIVGSSAGTDGLPGQILVKVTVANYEPGTKWFLPTDDGVRTSGGLSQFGAYSRLPSQVKLELYYRAVGEGPDPARMIL